MVLSKDGSTVWYVQNLHTTYLAPSTVPYQRWYRTSVQFLKRTVPTYHTHTITKKAYSTTAPYFLAKIEAYHTVLTYRTVLPSSLLTTRNFNWLWNHLPINQRSQFTHLTSALAVFCLCIQKAGAMVKSLGFLIQTTYQRTVLVPLQKRHTVPTYRTRTITKKAYRTSVPYLFAKIEAYRTVLPSLVSSIKIWKYKHTVVLFLAKLHWNKPTALRLAFITEGTYLRPKKELFLLLKKSN